MPIYEYECKFCHHKFEVLQKITDPAPDVCPNCGKTGGIHKLISEASFTLKGSGWYVTDYKKNNSTVKEENKTKGTPVKAGSDSSNKPKEVAKK